jgi:ABC-2 type transport system permease protein
MLVNRLTLVLNLPGPLAGFINFISLSYHFESFARGLIDTRDILFFALSSWLFLYLNTRALIFRKWK